MKKKTGAKKLQGIKMENKKSVYQNTTQTVGTNDALTLDKNQPRIGYNQNEC